MKKFFGILIMAMAISACSSDDDSNDTNINQLEGNWKMTAFNTENAYDLNGDGTASRNIMDETNCYQNETMVFNSDNTGRINYNTYADIELELIAGTTDSYEYNIECISDPDVDAFAYSQSGNQVTISTNSGESITGTISGNTLSYTHPGGYYFDVEDAEGGTVMVQEDVTIIYTKQ